MNQQLRWKKNWCSKYWFKATQSAWLAWGDVNGVWKHCLCGSTIGICFPATGIPCLCSYCWLCLYQTLTLCHFTSKWIYDSMCFTAAFLWSVYIFVDTLLFKSIYLYPTLFHKGLKKVINWIVKRYSHEGQGHTTADAKAIMDLIMVVAPTLPKNW